MGTLAKDSDTCSLDPQISEGRQCFCSPSSLQLPLLLQMQGSPVPSVLMRYTSLAGWSRWGLCQCMTTSLLTTAQPLEKTKVGVRTPCPDTTLECCLLLLSTTLDGAVHVCQTGGACDAVKEYTCDECIQGLEWVEAYIEDPIMIAEYVIYLEQNFCMSGGHHDIDKCKRLVVEHFANMHTMAMEKFFIPTEICMSEPVCGADPPTKPPQL